MQVHAPPHPPMPVALPEHPEKVRVILYPDPRLKKVSEPVADDEFGPRLRTLVERMFELMREHEGVGLAAPQVGVNKRLFVMNASLKTENPDEPDRVYINPVLSEPGGENEPFKEGCLSLPEINVNVTRPTALRIQARDIDGNEINETADGFITRVWQHETDHLDGILITDKMSPVEKMANRRKLRELEASFK
ncbi:MAG: peptide deformylase [Planctomycetota bacterium]